MKLEFAHHLVCLCCVWVVWLFGCEMRKVAVVCDAPSRGTFWWGKTLMVFLSALDKPAKPS
jgi:hypothetical protein